MLLDNTRSVPTLGVVVAEAAAIRLGSAAAPGRQPAPVPAVAYFEGDLPRAIPPARWDAERYAAGSSGAAARFGSFLDGELAGHAGRKRGVRLVRMGLAGS